MPPPRITEESEQNDPNIEGKDMNSQSMSQQAVVDRKKEALDVFKKYPDAVPLDLQSNILAQQVVIGMDPYMAHLAAGGFEFRVDADPTKWGKNADPYNVMWAQSQHPDDSQIWMTFQTDTQFPGEGEQLFSVCFKNGKAVKIEKLKGEK